VERQQELREDADGLFIPVADLGDARVGDTVVLTDGQTERRGVIASFVEDEERGAFVRVRLD
jgi:hypothetical protein